MNWKKKTSKRINNYYLAGVMALLLVGCGINTGEKESRVDTLPYYNEATFTPHWMDENDEKLADFHKIAPFSLINQEGNTITEKDYNGKIYVADFFFTTCPGICMKMTENMLLLQDAFIEDDDVLLISHSVTPKRDSVPQLKKYAAEKGIEQRTWNVVTGERKEIYALGRRSYFVEEDLGLEKSPDDFLHTENFVLVDGNRNIRGIYNGLKKGDINQLIADIKTLKRE